MAKAHTKKEYDDGKLMSYKLHLPKNIPIKL